MKSCKGCPNRHTACWDTCEDYKERIDKLHKEKEFTRMMLARNDTFERAAQYNVWWRRREQEKW